LGFDCNVQNGNESLVEAFVHCARKTNWVVWN